MDGVQQHQWLQNVCRKIEIFTIKGLYTHFPLFIIDTLFKTLLRQNHFLFFFHIWIILNKATIWDYSETCDPVMRDHPTITKTMHMQVGMDIVGYHI